MLLFKLLFATAVLTVGLFGFNHWYGDNAIFSDIKSNITESANTTSESCLPRKSVGNRYFQIKTPKGFCGCLLDGKKAISDGKGLGQDISEEDFIFMCADIYYKKDIKIQCNKINNMLSKAGKKRKLYCGCFSQKINKYLSYSIARDGLGGEQRFFHGNELANEGLKSAKKKLTPDNATKNLIYSVPKGVVTSCVK